MSELKAFSDKMAKTHSMINSQLQSNSDSESPHAVAARILVEQRLPDDLIFEIARIVNIEMPGLMLNLILTVYLHGDICIVRYY